ncbi:dynein beta chain, ciliary-like [Euwallacea similis]|uniref:dynein beta chain, ciliary-like n=1 Tax=Euwallacea similis TaxID=1736056 RepID=UPI003450FF23
MEQPTVPVVDKRLDFLGTYVQKSLKLKSEKWTRLIATEDYKAIVKKFLERHSPNLLVIILTPAAQLVPSNGFPLVQLKTKGVYFIKKEPAPVCKSSPGESVIVGDLSPKLVDQLASFVDEVNRLLSIIHSVYKTRMFSMRIS